MEYKKIGETFYVRMDRGDEIISNILEICRKESIPSAIFSGIGGCSNAELQSDVVKMASFLNEQGIAAIGLRYHLNKTPMPQGMKMPPMVDVTHPEVFPQADANPMHTASGDSIIRLAEQDAKAAIRMVRQHADEWNISKDKIGYLGFSAGGGVAIAATMSADSMERPNFLCTNFGPSLMPVTVPQDAPPLLIMTRADKTGKKVRYLEE